MKAKSDELAEKDRELVSLQEQVMNAESKSARVIEMYTEQASELQSVTVPSSLRICPHSNFVVRAKSSE